ncbi:alpha/beta hydrolase [Roseomonas populi]|uniref:Alpha/beta hydrolase n=1 Tax=Roseomonas populi TaxID=3121582 RepID=A0ABT1X3M8_9PROT|nr:alpha/beta hydrolase [Roseomonas pecuniae]MCR0982705.1 alpha/beta hydrolase [Roseomonas pecuniae]
MEAKALIFLHYTQDELDRAYDQTVWAPDMAGTMKRYAAESERQRGVTAPVVLRYGEGALQEIDLFPAGPGAPLLFFVHGGAWRAGTRDLYSFIASRLVEQDVAVAIPDFPKIGDVTLPGMARHVASAFAHTVKEAPKHGIDPTRVVLAGHSSGAHIAGCLLAGAEGADIPRLLRSALLISGMYEMEPVLLSSRSSYVTLSAADRHRLSPIRHLASPHSGRIAVVWGEGESPEFIRQSREYALAAAAAGARCEGQQIAGRGHFDILLDFLDPSSALTRTALRLSREDGPAVAP